jgi:hypothetical protein
MAEKTVAKEKKTAAAKPVAAAKKSPVAKATAKKPPSRKINKGDSLSCEVCGFSVTVDECGDIIEAEEIICCEKPMKPKARKVKVAAK